MVDTTTVPVSLCEKLTNAVLTRIRSAARQGHAPKPWRHTVPPYVSSRVTDAIRALLESAHCAGVLGEHLGGICEVLLEVAKPIPGANATSLYRDVSPRALHLDPLGRIPKAVAAPMLLECGDCQLEIRPEGVYRLTYRLRVSQTPFRVRQYGGYTVDRKCRLVVPHDFRNLWDEGRIILARGPNKTIIVASQATWLAMESQSRNPLGFQAVYGTTATQEEIDPASGRIVLPQRLRASSKMYPGKTVVFTGCAATGLLVAAEESAWERLDKSDGMADVLREVQSLLPTF